MSGHEEEYHHGRDERRRYQAERARVVCLQLEDVPAGDGANRPAKPHPVKIRPQAIGNASAPTRSAVAAGTSDDTAP